MEYKTKLEVERIKQLKIEIRKGRNEIKKQYGEILDIFNRVSEELSKEELMEFGLNNKQGIGNIYVDRTAFKEWESEEEINNLSTYYMVHVLEHAEDNLKALIELLIEVRQFYIE